MGVNLLGFVKTVSIVWIGCSSITPSYVRAIEEVENLESLLHQQQTTPQLITSSLKAFEAPDNGAPDVTLDSGTRNRKSIR